MSFADLSTAILKAKADAMELGLALSAVTSGAKEALKEVEKVGKTTSTMTKPGASSAPTIATSSLGDPSDATNYAARMIAAIEAAKRGR